MAKFKISEVEERDIEWVKDLYSPYKYHITLIHRPTQMEIKQASEASFSEAKGHCLKELHWRLSHWDDYQKSKMSRED